MDESPTLTFCFGPDGKRCYLPPRTYTLFGPDCHLDDLRDVVHLEAVVCVKGRNWYLASAAVDPIDLTNANRLSLWDKLEPIFPETAAWWIQRVDPTRLPSDLHRIAYGDNLADEVETDRKCVLESGPVRLFQKQLEHNVEIHGEPDHIAPQQWEAVKLLIQQGEATNKQLGKLRPALLTLLRERPVWEQFIANQKGSGHWEWLYLRIPSE